MIYLVVLVRLQCSQEDARCYKLRQECERQQQRFYWELQPLCLDFQASDWDSLEVENYREALADTLFNILELVGEPTHQETIYSTKLALARKQVKEADSASPEAFTPLRKDSSSPQALPLLL